MSRESRQAERLKAIRSISIEDIVHGRHTRWRRFVRRAKPIVLAVSLLGLTAAAGGALYQTLDGPQAGFPSERLASERTDIAATASAPAETGEAPIHTGSLPPKPTPRPVTAPSRDANAAALAALEPTLTTTLQPSQQGALQPLHPQPLTVARLPEPRPADAPATTGSIAPQKANARAAANAPAPRTVREPRFQPCRTLKRLTARLPFPRVTCDS